MQNEQLDGQTPLHAESEQEFPNQADIDSALLTIRQLRFNFKRGTPDHSLAHAASLVSKAYVALRSASPSPKAPQGSGLTEGERAALEVASRAVGCRDLGAHFTLEEIGEALIALSALAARLSSPTGPREWTAETIKDAPEGVYQTGTTRDDGRINWWGNDGYINRRYIPRRIHTRSLKQKRPLVFFGPIPQPPAQPTTGDRVNSPAMFPWWCPKCLQGVSGDCVTFQETHDTRSGGCGERVQPSSTHSRPQ